MSETGFFDVVTAPAGTGSVSVPDLGTFAPLAGPHVAPDGTVILGTLEGKVLGLRPDGSAYWNRQLLSGEAIMSSPAVGSDGSVYVVSSWVVHDHRGGETETRGVARLHWFTPGGGAPPTGLTDFPEFERGPMIVGAPKVWRFGTEEAVMVPAMYPTVGGYDLHLFAFSARGGGIMADWSVYLSGGAVTSDSWTNPFPFGMDFRHGTLPIPAPFPGVAISANPQGGRPYVTLVDRYSRRMIGFTFCIGASCSPAPGFTEVFRTNHDPRVLWSSPTTLRNMHTVVGTDDGVVFSGPNLESLPPVTGLGAIYATPTVATDGRTVLVNGAGETIGLRDGAVISRHATEYGTFARAAASRTHVFVSAPNALHTLDALAEASVWKFPWVGGGDSAPAIGPLGHVYAIASNVLFVFPPPRQLPRRLRGLDAVGGGHDLEVG